MTTLPDGTYDVIVVDAETTDDGEVRIELTITLGAHIGRVVALRASHVDDRREHAGQRADPLSLLGTPGTLKVSDGVPSFRPEVV